MALTEQAPTSVVPRHTPVHVENRAYVIAEMACSHDGDADNARTIIDGAGHAGADAIQFQIWKLEDIMVRHHPAFPDVKKLELPQSAWSDLAAYVRSRWPGLSIIACVYDEESVNFAESIGVDAYKLHAADLSNPQLVTYVADTERRIDLSVGASTIAEIEAALEWIAARSSANTWLMYGYQIFPTPIDAINLHYMMKLKQLFELPIGYQDHTDAVDPGAYWIPATAIGMGADIMEKHITHDRSEKGADHESALNPDEFIRFVKMVRDIDAARGSSVPRPFTEEERRYRVYAKKSLVAGRQLRAGSRLSADDLVALRAPDLGLPPARLDELIGRPLRRDIGFQQLVGPDDLE